MKLFSAHFPDVAKMELLSNFFGYIRIQNLSELKRFIKVLTFFGSGIFHFSIFVGVNTFHQINQVEKFR